MTTVKKFIPGTLDKREERFLRVWLKKENTLPRNTTEKQLMAYTFTRNKNQLYYYLVDEWNKEQDKPKYITIKVKKNRQKERERIEREKEENTEKTFLLNLHYRGVYYRSYYNVEENYRYSVDEIHEWWEKTRPFTKKNHKKYCQEFIENEVEVDDGYQIIDLVEQENGLKYGIEYMDVETLEQNQLPTLRQPMKRSYVLRNDWLTFSHGIAQYAYDKTDGTCVYHQLNKFLLDPPTGRPSKYINYEPTSEESLFEFFNNYVCTIDEKKEHYPNFDKHYGVSIEMIEFLCKRLKRNMYAYDSDQKLLHSVTAFDSKNVCPIVFYKIHGHFYIIDDPSVIRSNAEQNKKTGNKIISTTLEEVKEETNAMVHHIEKFNIADAATLEKGIYLLKQSNLDNEVIEFIETHDIIPETRTDHSSIVLIKYQQGFENTKEIKNRKYVIIGIDATTRHPYTYDQMKNVADKNNVKYTNGGMGSLIMNILDNKKKSCREFLTDTEKKEFIEAHHNLCSVCQLNADKFEIDHIIPLASGGSNNLSNLQPLCGDCHKKKTTEEKELGFTVKDEEASYFNPTVSNNVVNTCEFKTWQFVERHTKAEEAANCFKIDMKKCRRNLTYNSKYKFPVFTVMDTVTAFTGKIQCGFYYIQNTHNTFPLRGNGWYSQPMVEYVLDNQLITTENIVAELIPSNKLDNDYYQKPIDTLLNAFADEPTLQKLSVNSMVGLLGKTKHSASHTKFALCPHEAAQWWGDNKNEGKYDIFIRNVALNNGKTLYEGIFHEDIQMESTKYPLYKQILEMEAIELHKLESLIISNGGTVLDRNTDAIRYSLQEGRKALQFNHFWDDNNTVVKYQNEEPTPLRCEVLPNMRREKTFDLQPFELQWNTQYDYDGSAEEEAKRIIESNMSCHIDGRAGTGKSYLVNKIIDELKLQDKKFMGFSPTNKGARIINGSTIHSVYFQYQSRKSKLFKILKDVEYIFIDEVSMMIKDFYTLFVLIKRTFKTIKFIIAGDFGQLPPVKDNWVGDYEKSPAMNLLCGGNKIKLTTCRRSDVTLFNLCMNVNSVIKHDFKPTEETYLNIAYTHKTRKIVNHRCMERYIKEHKFKTFEVKADKLNPKTQDVTLAKGMPIMAHTTNKKLRFMNAETFVIDKVNNETMEIKNEIQSITINTKDFHKFFYLGFCLTIHASQGETFKDKYTIHDWYHLCEKGKYVALSRGTKLENIQIA